MDQIVTVFGGTGFLGRRVVRHLLDRGCLVRCVSRGRKQRDGPPDHTGRLQHIQADITDADAVAGAVEGAEGVVNAVSLYVEREGLTFQRIHVEAAQGLARAAQAAGARRLVLVSGIGADPHSPSAYIASRGRGEQAVRQAFPQAIVMRCAVMFGDGDSFIVPLADILRRTPLLPLFGSGETRLQPVWAEDVADAVARVLALSRPAAFYELAGPVIYSYRALAALLVRALATRTLLLPWPFAAWEVMARLAQHLPSPPITPDQVALMRIDTVASAGVAGLADLGIAPRALADVLPSILPDRVSAR